MSDFDYTENEQFEKLKHHTMKKSIRDKKRRRSGRKKKEQHKRNMLQHIERRR